MFGWGMKKEEKTKGKISVVLNKKLDVGVTTITTSFNTTTKKS